MAVLSIHLRLCRRKHLLGAHIAGCTRRSRLRSKTLIDGCSTWAGILCLSCGHVKYFSNCRLVQVHLLEITIARYEDAAFGSDWRPAWHRHFHRLRSCSNKLLPGRSAIFVAWYGFRTKQPKRSAMAKETLRLPGAKKKTSRMLCGIVDGFPVAYTGEGVRHCFSESIS